MGGQQSEQVRKLGRLALHPAQGVGDGQRTGPDAPEDQREQTLQRLHQQCRLQGAGLVPTDGRGRGHLRVEPPTGSEVDQEGVRLKAVLVVVRRSQRQQPIVKRQAEGAGDQAREVARVVEVPRRIRVDGHPVGPARQHPYDGRDRARAPGILGEAGRKRRQPPKGTPRDHGRGPPLATCVHLDLQEGQSALCQPVAHQTGGVPRVLTRGVGERRGGPQSVRHMDRRRGIGRPICNAWTRSSGPTTAPGRAAASASRARRTSTPRVPSAQVGEARNGAPPSISNSAARRNANRSVGVASLDGTTRASISGSSGSCRRFAKMGRAALLAFAAAGSIPSSRHRCQFEFRHAWAVGHAPEGCRD